MKSLRLAKDLSLPLDAVTQTIAILAKRRAGKSYAMRRLTEQLLKAGQQVVIVDPKGDQWGLRSAADGKAPGLPIVILGGERGDVPLEASSGEVVAKLVVEERVSVLLDLSQFRKHEVATFMTAFLENVYRLKAKEIYRTPVMLVIDEADAVAPQKPQKGEERMLGAAEDIVRRGGQRGIGCVLVTQRSAVLNKNVLTQAQVLVVLRTIAPQDLAAMKAWIDVHGDLEQGRILMESLPSLPVGDAWFWSPGWPTTDGIFKRVHVLPIETFDSGKSPDPGVKPVEPKNLADVDLEAIKGQMAATIEKAKADDPRELRRQIAELKRELTFVKTDLKPAKAPEIVYTDKAVLTDADRALLGKLAQAIDAQTLSLIEHDVAGKIQAAFEKVIATATREASAGVVKRIDEFQRLIESKGFQKILGKLTAVQPPAPVTNSRPDRPPIATPAPTRGVSRPQASRQPVDGEVTLKKCERSILTVLAQYGPCRRGKLTLLAGYAWTGSFRTSLSTLRTSGLIAGDNDDTMQLTDAGLARADYVDLPTGEALRQHWLSQFKLCERSILAALFEHPKGLTSNELCERTNYEWTGSFRTALSTLRTAGVLVGKNDEVMRASDDLL